jgi:hypothetical protein
MVRLGRGLRVGGAYTGASGAPLTAATEGFVVRDSATGRLAWAELPRTGAPGAERMPAYGRYDALIDWTGEVRGVRAGAFVQVHNVTRRANAVGAARGACEAAPKSPVVDGCFGGRRFDQDLPMIPLVGLRLSF